MLAISSRRWACVEPSGFVSRIDQANSTDSGQNPARNEDKQIKQCFFSGTVRYGTIYYIDHRSYKGKTRHAPYPLHFMTLSSEIWRTPKQESLWRIEAVLNRIDMCNGCNASVVSFCEASFTLLQLLRLLPEPSEDFSRFWTVANFRQSSGRLEKCFCAVET